MNTVGQGVREVRVRDASGAFRIIDIAKFADAIDVLHCFQKKSKSGIATPKQDLDLINTRLKAAKQDFEGWQAQQGVRK